MRKVEKEIAGVGDPKQTFFQNKERLQCTAYQVTTFDALGGTFQSVWILHESLPPTYHLLYPGAFTRLSQDSHKGFEGENHEFFTRQKMEGDWSEGSLAEYSPVGGIAVQVEAGNQDSGGEHQRIQSMGRSLEEEARFGKHYSAFQNGDPLRMSRLLLCLNFYLQSGFGQPLSRLFTPAQSMT